MKKIMFKLLTIIAIFNLAGCTTMGGNQMAKEPTAQALITPSIQKWMVSSDHEKFMNILSTAKPEGVATWENHDERKIYEFASLKIYINEKGQPCRIYRLRAASVWREHRMEGNACRINGSIWQGSSEEIK